MDVKDLDLSWINNRMILKNLEDFFTNLVEKKGRDIVAILIFGSLARGEARFTREYYSDVDLLIISRDLPEKIFYRKLYTAKLSKSLGSGIHMIKLINGHRAFFFEIIKYGRILYEQDQFFTKLKRSIEKIIKEKGIKELKNVWLWPQDTPGCKIDW
ncbi:MAG: nucleotidyltransferase domain-containing protein [Candidatus Helarchaeota archaeon]